MAPDDAEQDDDDHAEVIDTEVAVSGHIVQAASTVARHVHRNGGMYVFDLERAFAMDRSIDLGQLIEVAVARDWLIANGSRISPGPVEPELVTSATR